MLDSEDPEHEGANPPAPMEEDQGPPAPPHNIEAEQAVLGALLYQNSVYDRISSVLGADDFYDPLHAQIFEKAEELIRAGSLADAVVLHSHFERHEGMAQIGGTIYLADLMREGPDAASAVEYAKLVSDLALRRRLIAMGEDLAHSAEATVDEVMATELLATHESEIYDLARGRGDGRRRQAASFNDSTSRLIEQVQAAVSSGTGLAGLSTGLKSLDAKMGGLCDSDLIILAGRPSMGKTALATNIAFKLAKQFQSRVDEDGVEHVENGARVLVFSLEMSDTQLNGRVMADWTGISTFRQRTGKMSFAELAEFIDAAREIQHIPLSIDDTGGLDIDQLFFRARRHKRLHGLDLIVVDYLQLCTATGFGSARVAEVSYISQRLKAMAKELQVPVIALSQLSRQVESRDDKKPQLSDLRDSGSIEQDADVVLFCYREAYYLERMEPKPATEQYLAWEDELREKQNEADVIIAKNRHGRIGGVKLHFQGELTKFSDLETKNEP